MDAQKTEKSREMWKKVSSWIVTVVCIVLCVLAVIMLILTFAARKNGHRAVEIFGYSFSVVETDSMTGEIEVGELITVKICNIRDTEIGAHAVYIASEGSLAGRQIVHKVVETGIDEKGFFIITKGVKEGAPLDKPIYEADNRFVGIAVSHSVFFGKVAEFFSSPENWILLLALLVGVPCVYAAIKLVVRYAGEAKREKSEAETANCKKTKQAAPPVQKTEENDKDRKK